MTKRRRGEFLKAVFAVLAENPDGIQAKDALAQTGERLELTEYEKGSFDSGAPPFPKLVRFQTVNAVKARWMTKDKGIWVATEEGLAAAHKHVDPEAFMKEAEEHYAAWVNEQPKKPKATIEVEPTPQELRSFTVEEAEETAFAEVVRHLATMSPYDFQNLVTGLLRGMGYIVAWVAPPGKDRGVDILAFRDPLGTEEPRIKVQVKREKDKTDVKGLRSFMSQLNPGDVGVFVILGGFTSDAESEARNSETRRITLVDRGDLFDLWVQHYDRIPAEDRQLMPLKPVFYLATASDEDDDS